MGTVNHKGYKKLPPKPQPLNDDEVEAFGLEELEFDENDFLTASSKVEQETDANGIIVDEEGIDEQDNAKRKINKVDEKALKVYQGIRVEDMVKVTAPGKFFNEDAIVRR